ncbi:MAG: hypothetical protein VB064_06210 [Oscillospiraceae bacterium]|nr:hypothetical protein [Oscillospiraceae bacterium]
MTTTEKVAYLKGLADGLGLDKENKQDKLLAAVIEVLETVAKDLDELEDNALDLADEIDAISDDLADVEEIVYNDYDEEYGDDECCCGDHDDYDDECCCGGDHDHGDGCCCGGEHSHHDDSCCCGHHHSEPVFYEVTCPACENTITIDEDVLALGKIECPNCGEVLEFDMDSIEYEEEATDKE